MRSIITLASILAFIAPVALGIWCFECVSTQPGCGKPFNWWFLWSNVCKEDNDVCVKITERKGVDTVITRSCLSLVKGIRTDIPADTYEGCRPAVKDVKLGNYVNNSIKELDIYRDFYDSTEYCFCFLDHRCNGSSKVGSLTNVLMVASLLSICYKFIL